MLIWLLQISEPLPFDKDAKKLRTAFLADHLMDRGHSIVWWASAFNHLRKRWYFDQDTEVKVKDKLIIKTLKGIGYSKNISLSRLLDHRIIARKFRKCAPGTDRPDIIVCSMPSYDLAYEAVVYARKREIPILVDIRDQWPDNFLDAFPAPVKKLVRLALSSEFAMLKTLLKDTDGLISMTSSLLEWGLNNGGRAKTWRDQVFYLGGEQGKLPLQSEIHNNLDFLPKLQGNLVVTFIGTFASYHNPEIVIDCAKVLAKKNICFILAGDGELGEYLKAKALNLEKVFFPGWMNQTEITTLLKHSHVGICPSGHLKTKLFFPNKVFSYFSEGLPVITSFEGELAEVIDSFSIGFRYNDLAGLVKAVTCLHEDRQLLAMMKSTVKRVFEERFNTGLIYRRYAKHIERIVVEATTA